VGIDQLVHCLQWLLLISPAPYVTRARFSFMSFVSVDQHRFVNTAKVNQCI
jgi:hypothetical protein